MGFAFTVGGLSGLLALSASRLRRRLQPEVVLGISPSGIHIGERPALRHIPWDQVTTIDTDFRYPRTTAGPRVQIRLADDELVPVPAALYPEAESDFPTRQHIERAKAVADSLSRSLQASRQT